MKGAEIGVLKDRSPGFGFVQLTSMRVHKELLPISWFTNTPTTATELSCSIGNHVEVTPENKSGQKKGLRLTKT
jgi:hypothetical protein